MRMYRIIKRGTDIVLSCLALVILLPVFVIVAALIKIDSKGPVFYKQTRPGKDKQLFQVYKFRTMVQHADKSQQKGVEVKQDDHRITAIGKFLRRFKIDETAQFINVLKGDMSLVGPRPTLPDYIEDYEQWELERFLVRPGLTGLAQVNGGIYLDRLERSVYDVEYVKQMSIWLDTKIICKTILIVLLGEDKFVKKVSKAAVLGEEGVHRVSAAK